MRGQLLSQLGAPLELYLHGALTQHDLEIRGLGGIWGLGFGFWGLGKRGMEKGVDKCRGLKV